MQKVDLLNKLLVRIRLGKYKIVQHEELDSCGCRKDYNIEPGINHNDLYVFSSRNELYFYTTMFLRNANKEALEEKIVFEDKQGRIYLYKKELAKYIVRRRTKEFYAQYDSKKIEDIHNRGKLTPEDKVKEWEGFDLCAPGSNSGEVQYRCQYFHANCHDCLLEYASHQEEYRKVSDELKLVNSFNIKEGKNVQ